ncbi:hypothetical protein BC835DRAFT_1412818 [Cytidiella melzeri]|nr:hypothetical protein BC835DRAFT_1412818 [Cytidiella melzeri]
MAVESSTRRPRAYVPGKIHNLRRRWKKDYPKGTTAEFNTHFEDCQKDSEIMKLLHDEVCEWHKAAAVVMVPRHRRQEEAGPDKVMAEVCFECAGAEELVPGVSSLVDVATICYVL